MDCEVGKEERRSLLNSNASDGDHEQPLFSKFKRTVACVGMLSLAIFVCVISGNYIGSSPVNRSQSSLSVVVSTSSYKACKGTFRKHSASLNIPTRPGCVYLLTETLSEKRVESPMVAICSCQPKRNIKIDQTMLMSLGMVDAENFDPLITAVATGDSTDVILHRGKYFDGSGYKLKRGKQMNLNEMHDGDFDRHTRSITLWSEEASCQEETCPDTLMEDGKSNSFESKKGDDVELFFPKANDPSKNKGNGEVGVPVPAIPGVIQPPVGQIPITTGHHKDTNSKNGYMVCKQNFQVIPGLSIPAERGCAYFIDGGHVPKTVGQSLPAVRICSCSPYGTQSYNISSMQAIKLVGQTGKSLLSMVVTGPEVSVTLYLDGSLRDQKQYVIGPNSNTLLSNIAREGINGKLTSKTNTWNLATKSFLLNSWSSCQIEEGCLGPSNTVPPNKPTSEITNDDSDNGSTAPTPEPEPMFPTADDATDDISGPSAAPTLVPTYEPREPTPEPTPTFAPTPTPLPSVTTTPSATIGTVGTAGTGSHDDSLPTFSPTLVPGPTTLAPTFEAGISSCQTLFIPGVPQESFAPPSGCAYFFDRIPTTGVESTLVTLCSCSTMGILRWEDIDLKKVGLLDEKGKSSIAFIVTGPQLSITIFSDPHLDPSHQYTISPLSTADLTVVSKIGLASDGFQVKDGMWVNHVHSFAFDSWSMCNFAAGSRPCPAITTSAPVAEPTMLPTAPTFEPTLEPTLYPTPEPSYEPTVEPSFEPSKPPTLEPSWDPTFVPTPEPSAEPSLEPTPGPSMLPGVPTPFPTVWPTHPTHRPTAKHTRHPTAALTLEPTPDPTVELGMPTPEPTLRPTATPSLEPTLEPTPGPSLPTLSPTVVPGFPTPEPTHFPPTLQPTLLPTFQSDVFICQNMFEKGPTDFLSVPVDPGCAVFLMRNGLDTNNAAVMFSPMTTICTCDLVGPVFLLTKHMEMYGLMKGDVGKISVLATGVNVTVTLYDNENFSSDANKEAIGPASFLPLDQVHIDGDDDYTNPLHSTTTWNDNIKSMSVMSWVPCELSPKKISRSTCPDRVTSSPIGQPVRRP